MSDREPCQQDFLRAAKATLNVTWDQLADLAGIAPRALKNYRMPDQSTEHRSMPALARRAVQQLLDEHARKNRKQTA